MCSVVRKRWLRTSQRATCKPGLAQQWERKGRTVIQGSRDLRDNCTDDSTRRGVRTPCAARGHTGGGQQCQGQDSVLSAPAERLREKAGALPTAPPLGDTLQVLSTATLHTTQLQGLGIDDSRSRGRHSVWGAVGGAITSTAKTGQDLFLRHMLGKSPEGQTTSAELPDRCHRV